ncbi:hypothetical protein BRDID11004_47690 [Bradyrhizobium diazoefficiens]|uniref:Uncharacterized protein n=1 Tax=Bradyrhizobium diazoefficiens TaxID=1355477 RepID=A0A809ZUZ7_9BRAD|nr:hypothetical protein [Bradyrhizobium diazoefficiens]BBZ94328.1 hypothetical protein F07S3_41610 [Bradyrhizobium diazoefficiens]BCE56416.1 hypothetical protein XF5B_39280 [Bradyrhizobium diazoefficiens]
MPTIRFLTPADYADMCAIIDKHSSGPGAWCNDKAAPAAQNFRQLAKDHVDLCFGEAMSNFWGYFDDAGKLVAWTLFIRWQDSDNITIRLLIEDPDADLPRADGAVWSEAAVDLVNWGIGYCWTEGVSFFWSRIYAGREANHVSDHPNCMLGQYQKEAVLAVAKGALPPPEYRRVSWSPVDYDTTICKFTDPLPLAQYLEDQNAQTRNAQ